MDKTLSFLTVEMVESSFASRSKERSKLEAKRLERELMKIARESSGEDLPERLCAKLYEVLPRPQSKEEELGDAAYIQYILSRRSRSHRPADPAASTLKNLLS